MDYVREAIEHLRAYNDLQFALLNLSAEIEELRANMPDARAITIDGMPKGSGSSDADDVLVNKVYRLQMAKKAYAESLKAVKKIDSTLDDISQQNGCEKYGMLLRMWFIQHMDKEDISRELSYSVRQLYNIKDIALKKFAIQYFGIKVIV